MLSTFPTKEPSSFSEWTGIFEPAASMVAEDKGRTRRKMKIKKHDVEIEEEEEEEDIIRLLGLFCLVDAYL